MIIISAICMLGNMIMIMTILLFICMIMQALVYCFPGMLQKKLKMY